MSPILSMYKSFNLSENKSPIEKKRRLYNINTSSSLSRSYSPTKSLPYLHNIICQCHPPEQNAFTYFQRVIASKKTVTVQRMCQNHSDYFEITVWTNESQLYLFEHPLFNHASLYMYACGYMALIILDTFKNTNTCNWGNL